jgi:hypothetical protein
MVLAAAAAVHAQLGLGLQPEPRRLFGDLQHAGARGEAMACCTGEASVEARGIGTKRRLDEQG